MESIYRKLYNKKAMIDLHFLSVSPINKGTLLPERKGVPMARYVQTFPIVEDPAVSFDQIRRYLTSMKYIYRVRDGQQLFQKGDGVWLAPSFVRVVYHADCVCLEAWVDIYGKEQDMGGMMGSAVKKPLKKVVARVEEILCTPGQNYVHVHNEDCFVSGQLPNQQSDVVEVLPANKKEFLKKCAPESFYTNLRICAICGYVLCGINALTALVNPAALLDVAIYLGLLLGMHLGKSKGCAIGALVYAIFGTVLNLVLNHVLVGWAWLVVGIYSVIVFNNAEKAYREKTK